MSPWLRACSMAIFSNLQCISYSLIERQVFVEVYCPYFINIIYQTGHFNLLTKIAYVPCIQALLTIMLSILAHFFLVFFLIRQDTGAVLAKCALLDEERRKPTMRWQWEMKCEKRKETGQRGRNVS